MHEPQCGPFEGSFGLVLIVCFSIRSDYECFQIELAKNYGQTEWREDIKSIMLKAGLQNMQITFLFVDTQVKIIMVISPPTIYPMCGNYCKQHHRNAFVLLLNYYY